MSDTQTAKQKERTESDRSDVLKQAIARIEKSFGRGSVMLLAEEAPIENVEVVPSGIAALDRASHIGGFPRGRIVEIFGLESSGKTSIALSLAAQVQKQGGIVAFVDAEHALDLNWAKKLGVVIGPRFAFSQPDSAEQALSIVSALLESAAVDLVIVDSVAALVPQAEIDGEVGEFSVGLQARLMSQAMRKLSALVSKTKSIVVFINQIRQKIGVFYGPQETTTGGNALKYYASMRLEVKRTSLKVQDSGAKKSPVGAVIQAKFVKNKIAPPFGQCEILLDFSRGFVDK